MMHFLEKTDNDLNGLKVALQEVPNGVGCWFWRPEVRSWVKEDKDLERMRKVTADSM